MSLVLTVSLQDMPRKEREKVYNLNSKQKTNSTYNVPCDRKYTKYRAPRKVEAGKAVNNGSACSVSFLSTTGQVVVFRTHENFRAQDTV